MNSMVLKYIDRLAYVLIILVGVDYITGVMAAAIQHKVSSKIGYQGILKKLSIFLIIFVAYVVDYAILDEGVAIRTTITIFYIANEGISIIENATIIGIPIPNKLKVVLHELYDKNNKD